jgi:hypothetical protein
MTEIKKTLTILKARWPEVALIIGLHILATKSSIISIKLMPESMRNMYLITLFMSLILLLSSIIIRTILRCGFLKTVHLEGQKRQTLIVLLRTGKHFFWRMFVLGLIYSLPLMLPIIVFSKLISPNATFWFYTLYPILVNLILIKLIILIPALIIVLDCRVFDSFKFLRLYKLSNAKELVFLYCGNIAIGLGSILSRYYWGTSCGTTCCSTITTSQYILRIMSSTVANFISLMTAIMAVRFVASVGLVHDSNLASLDFEDLQKSQNRNLKE